MKWTLRVLIVLGVLLPICTAASVKKLNYEIMAKGRRIGAVVVTESREGNRRLIEVSSQATIKMVFSVSISYTLQVVYEDGHLIFSTYHAYRSGRLHSSTTVWRRKGHYLIRRDGEEFRHDALIPFSGALLYFEEPGETKLLFSEMDGHVKNLSRLGPGHYRVINPKDDQATEYRYQDGLLLNILVHHRILPFSVELRK